MELQLYDSGGGPLFRVLRGEPLWRTFHRALFDASELPHPEAELNEDLLLQPARTRIAVATLESALRHDLAHALAQGKGMTGPPEPAIGAITATVLGHHLSLDLRAEEDLALSRINGLVVALGNAYDAGLSVHVLVVPEWPRIARELAWMLNKEPDPIATDDLRARLLHRLEELRLRSFDPESAQIRADDADLVRQHGLDDALDFLTTWHMVVKPSPREVRPTEKLRMMVM